MLRCYRFASAFFGAAFVVQCGLYLALTCGVASAAMAPFAPDASGAYCGTPPAGTADCPNVPPCPAGETCTLGVRYCACN